MIRYTYGSSGGGAVNLNRFCAIKDDDSGPPGDVLASLTYVGFAQVVVLDCEEPDGKLDLFGGSPGTYAGLDRFGRVADQKRRDYGASADRDPVTCGRAPSGTATVPDGSFGARASSSYDNEYRFTGRRWDAETGLYYYRARYYDSQLGRFGSRDPIGYDAGDFNLNRYCGNAPPTRDDPIGLWHWGNAAGDYCGPYVKLYTGSWCVKPNVWHAAMGAAGVSSTAGETAKSPFTSPCAHTGPMRQVRPQRSPLHTKNL